MNLAPYHTYKDSNSQWLGKIPGHWEAKKLKFLAVVQPSNVDKKTVEGENSVQLCNYTDVYKNEYIDGRLEFMRATATEDEIKKFSVDVGDVIVTKDSETPDDIAVPACVAEKIKGLLCGYHLTQIKPVELDGRYLLRLFQSKGFNAQFTVAANGVTRFGLPQYAIANAFSPLPSFDEQQTIARFLDYKTGQIDALIAKKEALLAKLAEKRTALISHTVTKGLDPSAPMKDSGVEWLGKIPEHWRCPPLYNRYTIELGKMLNENRISGKHLIPYLRNIDVQWDAINTQDLPFMDIRPDEYARYLVGPGDLLVCEGGEVGRAAIVTNNVGFLGFQKALHRLRCIDPERENSRFMFYLFNWSASSGLFLSEGNPNTIPHLTGEKLRRYRFPCPPIKEQESIADWLDLQCEKILNQQRKTFKTIETLKEYRSALITNAVTGKIDVRRFPIPATGQEATDA